MTPSSALKARPHTSLGQRPPGLPGDRDGLAHHHIGLARCRSDVPSHQLAFFHRAGEDGAAGKMELEIGIPFGRPGWGGG